MLDLSVYASICLIVLYIKTLLPQDDVTVVRVIILLGRVKITEHEGKGDIFLRNYFWRRVAV